MEQTVTEYISKPMQVSMADSWFDTTNTRHFWMQLRFGAMKKLFTGYLPENGNFLEIGCGNCVFRDQVEENLKLSIDACDLNEFALKKAKNGKGKVMVYDIMEQNPKLIGKYDGIFMMDVIEHIEDHVSFVKAAARHVKPGGIIIINVPAFMSLYGKYDIAQGHFRRYTFKTMNDFLLKLNSELDFLKMSYWGGFMYPVLVARNFVLKFKKDNEVVETGFAPHSKLSNAILHGLKNVELGLGIPFQKMFGSSLMIAVRTKNVAS